MNRNNIFIILLLPLLLSGCGGNKEDEALNTDNGTIRISGEQFAQENMEIGDPGLMLFDDVQTVSGKIVSPADGITRVSSKIDGIIEHVYVNTGDYVQKSQILFTVSSNEIIILQQNLAETSILLEKLESDYKRVSGLFKEQISSEKEFITIESEYNSTRIKYNSLKLQLQRIGLNTDKIETGNFYTAIPVYSPIEGYVTDINVVLGEYVEPQTQLLELVDANKLQVEFYVYEKYLGSVVKGNSIEFSSLASPDRNMTATIISVGKTVDRESNTVKCLAKPESVESLINNSYVEVFLKSKNREVMTLPDEALVKSDGNYYVFMVKDQSDGEYTLIHKQVEVGANFNGYTEILNPDDLGNIIINGAYNLQVM